jgi:hypothetical protein
MVLNKRKYGTMNKGTPKLKKAQKLEEFRSIVSTLILTVNIVICSKMYVMITCTFR